jgi:hypothetical protein
MAKLVEDSVVGQMVFGLRGDDTASMQDGNGILGCAARPAQPLGVSGVVVTVEIADDNGDLAEAFGGQPSGQRLEGTP